MIVFTFWYSVIKSKFTHTLLINIIEHELFTPAFLLLYPLSSRKEEKDKLKKMMAEQKKYYASITWFSELRKKANLQNGLSKVRGARR